MAGSHLTDRQGDLGICLEHLQKTSVTAEKELLELEDLVGRYRELLDFVEGEMQTLAAIIADLAATVASLALISWNVSGAVKRVLYSIVSVSLCLFIGAYILTCANKDRCDWTKKELKGVLYCSLRPDQCTHLISYFADGAQSEYWKDRASRSENDNKHLRNERTRLQTELESKAQSTQIPNWESSYDEPSSPAQQDYEWSSLGATQAPSGWMPEQEPNRLLWTMTNGRGQSIAVKFFSRSRRGFVWPDGGRAFSLNGSSPHPMALSCQPGEMICFGAWLTNRPRHQWGAGRRGTNGCSDCCAKCGSGELRMRFQ